MKTIRFPLLAGLLALLFLPAVRAAESAPVAGSGKTVYVAITSPDLIAFNRLRQSRADGTELILSTLKNSAAEQARFAEYPGTVVVLEENAKAPEGAPVLLLDWSDGSVTATLVQGGREKYLGVVSRTPLSYHPDFKRMRQEIDRHQLREERRDAELRAATQMNLFKALQFLARYQAKA